MSNGDFMKRVVEGAMKVTETVLTPINSISKAMAESGNVKFTVPYQRRGDFFSMGQLAPTGSTSDKKKTRKQRVLTPKVLRNLANTDPITFSIRQTRRTQVSQTEWTLSRDTDAVESELDQWQSLLRSKLNNWDLEGFDPYEPDRVPKDIYRELEHQIKGIISGAGPVSEKRAKLRWLFENAIDKVRYDSEKRANAITIFKRPCREYPSWNQFIPIVIDDILMFDTGVIIKNKCPNESVPIAEFYTRPGEEIYLLRNEDGSVPEPPEEAYEWEQQGKRIAGWHDDEMMFIVANPQQDFYGMSPLEVAAYIITTTLYIDGYNIDFFKHSNVPPGVLDLGEGVTPDNRKIFRTAWEQEIARAGGLHRMMFMSGSKGVNYIPLRPYSSKDMQMIEYLKWSLAIKAACFQISPQDIGFTQDLHRTTAEVQYEITKDRGLKALLRLLAAHINVEVIERDYKAEFVKFEYITDAPVDKAREATIDAQDIQIGVISRNDRRRKINKRPKEGGDIILVESPHGLIPIEMLDDVAEKMLMEGEEVTFPESPNVGNVGPGGATGSPTASTIGPRGAGPRPVAPSLKGSVKPKTAAIRPEVATKPKPTTIRAKGNAKALKRALDSAASDLRKQDENIEFVIDLEAVVPDDELNNVIRKELGFTLEKIDYGPPLLENEELIKQYTSMYEEEHGKTPAKEIILESMKGDIIRQAGGDPSRMSTAMDDALSGNRYKMKHAIPTLLGMMLASMAAGGFSRSVRGVASNVGRGSYKKIANTLRRSRSMLGKSPSIRRI